MSGPAPENGVLSLVGPRGSGKSTVGRLLADRLGWRFADSDAEVVARAGRPIAEIFRDDGEPAFRSLEAAAVRALLASPRTVLATGGGAVLNAETRAALRAAGLVAYLSADAATLHARTAGDPNRPALTDLPAAEEVAKVLADREPLYREVADVAIETAGRSAGEVVRAILAAIEPGAQAPAVGAADASSGGDAGSTHARPELALRAQCGQPA